MNDFDTSKETALLDELTQVVPQKGKLFNAFIISSVLFIGFVVLDFLVNLEDHSLKTFDWQVAILILLLPVSGIVFYCADKRVGWIVSAFYYFLLAALSLYTYIKMLFFEKMSFLDRTNWRGVLILVLTLTSSAILSANTLRKHFRAGILLFTILLVTSVGLAITMALTVLSD